MIDLHKELGDLLADHCIMKIGVAECSGDNTTECGDCLVNYLIAHGVTIQRWIPVTEQLPHFYPEKRRKVLVTIEDCDGKRFVSTAKYDEDYKEWTDFTDWRFYGYHARDKFRVIAWMLKPERYNLPEVVAGDG